MAKHLIFVYGTLRMGYGNHSLIKDSKLIGAAITREKYYMFANGIPYVTKPESLPKSKLTILENPIQITGEVYAVTKAKLDRLDLLEGHPNWYKREEVRVIVEDGTELSAWLYFNDEPDGELCINGDYGSHRKPYTRGG